MIQQNEVMYDSPEAARPVSMIADGKELSKGYLSIDNFFYKDESMARYQSATHRLCECGNKMSKNYTLCESCIAKKSIGRYKALPFTPWDGETPLCIFNDDKYFFSEESIIDYCEDNDVDPKDLCLMICEPNHLFAIDVDIWADMLPEDADAEDCIPEEIFKQIKVLNELIKKAPPVSWCEGKIRTEYQGEKLERSVAENPQ